MQFDTYCFSDDCEINTVVGTVSLIAQFHAKFLRLSISRMISILVVPIFGDNKHQLSKNSSNQRGISRRQLQHKQPILIIWRLLIETNGSRGGWTHVDSLMIVFQFLSAIVDFRHKTELLRHRGRRLRQETLSTRVLC